VLFGNSDSPQKLTRVNLFGQSAFQVDTVGATKGAPAIGSDGLIYSASYSGRFLALAPNLFAEWEIAGLGTVESSVALDCARDGAGAKLAGRPGVAYVGSNNGKLYSFIVDSRGIDIAARWPKYQHDPRNTANSSTPLSEFACP
jgi:hypothetical protein